MEQKYRFIFFLASSKKSSADLSHFQAYKVRCRKTLQPRFIKFKNQNDSILYEDPISLSPIYCATKLKGLDSVYSEPFIEYFYSQTKQDYLSGSFPSEANDWKEYAFDIEACLSKCDSTISFINGGMD